MVRGEPGVGKTALLDYLDEHASGCRVARAVGVESEMELAFAGLHQLCAPMLDRLERLPAPQRDALRTAFGLSAGAAPDRFLVGLAVLSLLAEVAEEQPLVCVVDDEQWLDRASAQVLGFVARRLVAESVGLVFAARVPSDELAGLPELLARGLQEAMRGRCWTRRSPAAGRAGPRPDRRRDARQPAGAARAAPRADARELAGGFGLPAIAAPADRGELPAAAGPLPAETRSGCCWSRRPSRSATRAGVASRRAARDRRRGRDPGGRGRPARGRRPGAVPASAGALGGLPVGVAAGAPGGARALAQVTDPELDPDRRAWHRAHATPGPDEEVAAELERSAGRAQARGGLAAAAAFLERAVALTVDPARRAERALAAAQAKPEAGAFDAALGLLATAEAGPLDELQRARVDLLRGQIAFASGLGSEAPRCC